MLFAALLTRSQSVLKLAHFGNVSSARLDIAPFLTSLARSGLWERIEFHVYGSDWTGKLRTLRDVTIAFHELRPWSEVAEIASTYDLAIVIGNRDPKQLPSKAVWYLQLPVPRLAIVEDPAADALAEYIADKKGWMILPADADRPAAKIYRHYSRMWSRDDLAAPLTESWERVADDLALFIKGVLGPEVPSDV